jgi:hypothetical protein
MIQPVITKASHQPPKPSRRSRRSSGRVAAVRGDEGGDRPVHHRHAIAVRDILHHRARNRGGRRDDQQPQQREREYRAVDERQEAREGGVTRAGQLGRVDAELGTGVDGERVMLGEPLGDLPGLSRGASQATSKEPGRVPTISPSGMARTRPRRPGRLAITFV